MATCKRVSNSRNGLRSERAKPALLVEPKVMDLTEGINAEKATDLKDIAHHADDPVMLQLGNYQPAKCPYHDFVGPSWHTW
jgi:hypothetical protein